MEKLYIVGFGPGAENIRTGVAKEVINNTKRVLSTGRISDDIGNGKKVIKGSLSEIRKELEENRFEPACVIVSGDCGFFSVSKSLIEMFENIYNIELINGVSSVQYFSGKIAVPYDDAILCSMHGRHANITAKVAYNKKLFVLTGGLHKAHTICNELHEKGLGGVRVCVGENLSYENERIVSGCATEIKNMEFSDLSVMYIENDMFVNSNIPLKDNDFVRGAVPMTKEEVRWIAINKLSINHDDTIFDIGAGTGSVSVEMARKATSGTVYAIEMDYEAQELISLNRKKHGAFNITIVSAKAPDGIKNLPMPDKAFIGGSSGNMADIMRELAAINPNIKITATAVTLQSVSKIIECMQQLNFDTDIVCVNVAKAKKIGGYDMMTAQNPVYIITGGGA